MSSFDTVTQDLVIANRILAKEDVVDAYGHVSVRHPDTNVALMRGHGFA
jgi:HCOMODA/2-hydroxy-3-carboxy-muconic semialdehyde decarboxylase